MFGPFDDDDAMYPTYDRMLSVDDGNTDVVLEQVVPIRSFYQEGCDTVAVAGEMELEKSKIRMKEEDIDAVLAWLEKFATALAFDPAFVVEDGFAYLVF